MQRIEESFGQERTIIDQATVYLTKYEGDIWYPGKILEKTYDRHHNLLRKTTTIVKDVQVNLDVSNELFKIKFPKGLDILDTRTSETFVAE